MKLLITLFVLLTIIWTGPAFATNETVTLPNGQILNITNLTNSDILQAITLSKKSMLGMDDEEEKEQSAISFISGIDPTEIDSLRKLITGTIKDVCNDLSITVNEFVKTPVGLGVAALIIYKIANGENLVSELWDVIVLIPFWCICTTILIIMTWYFFGMKIEYTTYYGADRKPTSKTSKRVSRYKWSNDNNKEILAWCMSLLWVFISFMAILLVVL